MKIFKKISWPGRNTQSYSINTSKEERDEFCSSIISASSPSFGFYLLLLLSTFIVTVGLIKDNLILLIGGMLVAPLLSPILSISLSLTILNFKVLLRSLLVFILSAATSFIAAALIGLSSEFNLLSIGALRLMNHFDFATLLIPIAAGAAASFTWAKKDLISSLSGVAVTVTLLPPLAAMGLALSVGEELIFKDALAVYGLNVLGIIIGSLTIFLLLGFYKSAKKVIQEVKKEEGV